jgi:hypothetical protein
MDIDKIMKLTQRRSELLAELSTIDAQIRAEASSEPKKPARSEPKPVQTAKGPLRGDDRLPYGCNTRVVDWAGKQQGPFTAYHACKELGLESRHEKQMAHMLAVLAREGKIERMTEGTATAMAIYKRKALQAVAS